MIGSLPHTCTIQRRYQKQKLSYAGGTAAFHTGATVTGGVSGATAVIDRIVGTTVSGYLILKTVSGTFQSGEAITDSGTPHGSATTSAAAVGYTNDSGEKEYYWSDDQTGVMCRFYSVRSRVVVLEAGQNPGMTPYVILPATVTVAHMEYRIKSAMAGYTPTSGLYQIMSVKAPTNRFQIDHYTLELKEIPAV